MNLIRRNRKSTVIVLLCLSAAIVTIVTASSNSRVIPFQGLLTDGTGTPVADGTYDLTFTLYGASDAVVPLEGWFEYHIGVPVKNGRFSVVLGKINSFDNPPGGDAISFSEPKYIGIQVGTDDEMRPRKQIIPAIHAHEASEADHAALADRAITSDNGVPVGCIMPYMGTSAPVGWLLCNNDPVPAGSEYDTLRAIVGSNVPDIRGMFLRGAGQNSNSSYQYSGDSARLPGIGQDDATKLPSDTTIHGGRHKHAIGDWRPPGGVQPVLAGAMEGDGHWADKFVNWSESHSHTISGGDPEETRPNNYAVNYIIKY